LVTQGAVARFMALKLSKVTIITIIIMAVPKPWPSSSAAKLRIKARRDVRTRSHF
jgi:hypothetical protein